MSKGTANALSRGDRTGSCVSVAVIVVIRRTRGRRRVQKIMKNTWMGLFVNALLRSTLIKIGMRLELEHQKYEVDQEQHDTATAADFQG